MNKPKDGMGNELEKGHTVLLKFDPPMLIGTITQLSLGGLVIPGRKGVSPGTMEVVISYTLQFVEDAVIGKLIRVVNPKETERAVKLFEEMKKLKPN